MKSVSPLQIELWADSIDDVRRSLAQRNTTSVHPNIAAIPFEELTDMIETLVKIRNEMRASIP
jgi:hypothetical protein